MRQTSWLFIFLFVIAAVRLSPTALADNASATAGDRQARARHLIDTVIAAVNKGTAQASSRGKRRPAHEPRVEIGADGKPLTKDEFQTLGCDNIPSSKWLALLISDEPVRHSFKFKKGCDLEGTLAISKNASPVDLDIRHVPGLTHVRAVVEPDIDILWSKRMMSVTLNASRGEFLMQSQSVMQFNADYNVGVGMSGDLEKNNGGTVKVKKYEGQPLKLAHAFKIE